MKTGATNHQRRNTTLQLCLLSLICAAFVPAAIAQDRERAGEIVANLAGGRVIVHVAHDAIIFAAIDQPIETNSIPPRAMNIDSTHIGILLGASEWRIPADPKPVRLDKDFPHVSVKNPNYAVDTDQVEPDLETIGVAFLERLRPLVSQLSHKIEFKPDEALFEVVVIGYAPADYGPEVWTIEYRIQQEEIATRGDFWQTRLLRPRFTQLYPPDKKAPKTLLEIRYPETIQGPTLLQLIEGNEPDLDKLSRGEPRFSKVVENIDRGQASKSVTQDATDFLRAALPIISEKSKFFLGTMSERGFNWVVPPDEPLEKAQEDKNRPPEAPSLRGKIKP